MSIPIYPNGTFKDYIAFYFGRRSPMLYNIKNGYQGVTKRSQEKIIYLITSLDEIIKLKIPYMFFDGHGYHNLSQPFNSPRDLANIDWNIINSNGWHDTESDPDRKRRKQAECLILNSIPTEALINIVSYNHSSKLKIESILDPKQLNLKIIAKPEWYY